MMSPEEMMNDINNNRDNIARAIALSYADGNDKKAKEYYGYIYSRVSEQNVFVMKTEKRENPVYSKIDETKEKITDLLKGVKSLEDKNFKLAFEPKPVFTTDFFKANTKGIKSSEVNKLHDLYFSCSKMFAKLAIPYSTFIDVYKDKGYGCCEELTKNVKKLQNQIFMIGFKLELKSLYDSLVENEIFKNLIHCAGGIVDRYGIKSTDDFMKFYTECSSFFIDTNKLSKDERNVIEENKKDFMKRPNTKGLVNNRMSLSLLRQNLEIIYSNARVRNMLENSNVVDFISRNKLNFDKNSFIKAAYDYFHLANVSGIQHFSRRENKSYILFNYKELLDSNSKWINNLVVHEFVHGVDKGNMNRSTDFGSKCRFLNEAITDYIAVDSLKYLDKNILSRGNKQSEEVKSAYECMFPMLEIVKKSSMWDDLLKSKLSGDLSHFYGKYGKQAKEINDLFKSAFKKYNLFKSIDKEIEGVKNIVKKVDKQNLFSIKK